jgi:hypothetical protein
MFPVKMAAPETNVLRTLLGPGLPGTKFTQSPAV